MHDISSQAAMIPVDIIDVDETKNPRRSKSQTHIDELRESIRSQGVIQSLTVRPNPANRQRFLLVAGYTRFKLACEVGLTEVPCVIRELTDSEARIIAIIENVQRADMTPIDEGAAAAQLLQSTKNDYDEVCRILVWTPKKLKSRILLSHACEEVSQALCDRQIKLGHAEILCALRPDAQRAGLKRIQEQNLSVDETLERIGRGTLNLQTAIFNTDACKHCHHNSDHQSTLFDNDFAGARCMNAVCFTQKTDAAVENIIATELESFAVVHRDVDVAKDTHITIVARGGSGVGDVQFDACKGCGSYGAIVRTSLSEAGRVERGQCFNLVCHSEKVAAYQAVIAPAPITSTAATASGTQSAAGAPSTPAKKKDAVVDSLPQKIVERHHEVIRKGAADAVRADRKIAYAIAILSMLADAHIKLSQTPRKWPISLSQLDRGTAMSILLQQSEEYLNTFMLNIAASVAEKGQGHTNIADPRQLDGSTFGAQAHAIVRYARPALADHFAVDKDYLDALTKPVIGELLRESGFVEFHKESNSGGVFEKLLAGKKGDLIDTVCKSSFNFSGYLPEALKKLVEAA